MAEPKTSFGMWKGGRPRCKRRAADLQRGLYFCAAVQPLAKTAPSVSATSQVRVPLSRARAQKQRQHAGQLYALSLSARRPGELPATPRGQERADFLVRVRYGPVPAMTILYIHFGSNSAAWQSPGYVGEVAQIRRLGARCPLRGH